MSAIIVQHLSKAYRIGHKTAAPDTLVGALQGAILSPFRNLTQLRRLNTNLSPSKTFSSSNTLWALNDVCFEVQHGDVLGVIGRNGAGKSTLLKVLSRITDPTKGRVVIEGRVSSLLEVGTGFHPELTGRDNIYMNGTILGMTRKEIDRKFDAIVDFSGVEKFLDTPTKRYSSGMQVRLAFAVAAHLEPEILIVDEVLAVGDADFQRKCMGKMRDVASSGRTVIFVSHNLASVRELCSKSIVMQSGKVEYSGTVEDAIARYVDSLTERSLTPIAERTDRGGSGLARFVKADVTGIGTSIITTGAPAVFLFEYESEFPNLKCVFTIYDDRGDSLMSFSSQPTTESDTVLDSNGRLLECKIDEFPLLPGKYRVNVALQSSGETLDHVEGAICFTTEAGYMRGRATGHNPYARMTSPHQWTKAAAPQTSRGANLQHGKKSCSA